MNSPFSIPFVFRFVCCCSCWIASEETRPQPSLPSVRELIIQPKHNWEKEKDQFMKPDHHHHHPHRLLLDTEDSAPSAADGTSARTRNFDTNMVIILAALLCALICALGLNSIVRCALRCGRRRLPFDSADATSSTAAKGLKKRALSRIPVAVYGSGINIPATDCAICLGEFVEGEKVRVLPKCRHGFHVRCVDLWLASNSSCPTCRRSLLEQPASSDPADVEGGLRHPSGQQSDDVPESVEEEG